MTFKAFLTELSVFTEAKSSCLVDALMVTVFRSLSDQRLLQTPTGTRVTLALESPLSSTKRSHMIQVQVRNVMPHDNAQWGPWLIHHIPPDVLSADVTVEGISIYVYWDGRLQSPFWREGSYSLSFGYHRSQETRLFPRRGSYPRLYSDSTGYQKIKGADKVERFGPPWQTTGSFNFTS